MAETETGISRCKTLSWQIKHSRTKNFPGTKTFQVHKTLQIPKTFQVQKLSRDQKLSWHKNFPGTTNFPSTNTLPTQNISCNKNFPGKNIPPAVPLCYPVFPSSCPLLQNPDCISSFLISSPQRGLVCSEREERSLWWWKYYISH